MGSVSSVVDYCLQKLHPSVGILTGTVEAILTDPRRVISTLLGRPEYTPKIEGYGSISFIENLSINGSKISILVRGQNKCAPIILIVHGGPGSTDIPFYRGYSDLEARFVVVHFDQRAACKSFYQNHRLKNFKNTLNVEQHVLDTIAVAEHLLQRKDLNHGTVHRQKLFLLGGSWGSMLGLLVAKRRPELFEQLLFRGMCTSSEQSERIGMDFVLKRMADMSFSQEAIAKVAALGPPYGRSVGKLIEQRRWLNSMGGTRYKQFVDSVPVPLWRLEHDMAKYLMLSSELSIFEILLMKFGVTASLEAMWPDVETMELAKEVQEVQVPITVVHGRHDFCTAYSLVDGFLKELKAPRKALVTFECSGHSPQIEEPEYFVQVVQAIFSNTPVPDSCPYKPQYFD